MGSGIGHLLTEAGVIGGGRISDTEGWSFTIRDLDVPRGYVAALAAERLPAGVEVTPFPDCADALAAFLAPPLSAR